MKAKLIALLLMIATVSTAQEKVNHLVYKNIGKQVTKKGTEVFPSDWLEIDVTEDFVMKRSKSADGKTSATSSTLLYDIAKDVIIKDYYVMNAYFIERKDSFLQTGEALKDLNLAETINGYNCKVYSRGNQKLWITEDITIEESEEVAAFSIGGKHDYKGVIVKTYKEVEYGKVKAIYEMVLDKAESLKNKPVIEMPWLRKGAEAILPDYHTSYSTRDPNNNNHAPLQFTPVTAETDIRVITERLRKLLTTVTGIEKPKTRKFELNYSYMGG